MLDSTVAAQNFEYKMPNILDKPLYTVCLPISCLLCGEAVCDFCSQEVSVHIGTSRDRVMSMIRGLYRKYFFGETMVRPYFLGGVP